MRYENCADQLEELALHYRVEGRGDLAKKYQFAASEIRTANFVPPDPSRMDNVSISCRDDIAEWMAYGEIPKLTEMREKRPYLGELTRVKSLGPRTAKKIYDETGVETIDGLEGLLESGEITEIKGVGSKTATTFRRSVAQLDRKS